MKRILIPLLALLIASGAHAALKIQSWTLDNGARVLFVEKHTIPLLDLSVEFDAGARRDPPGKSGVAVHTNAMLTRGIQAVAADSALNEAQISAAFADTAAQRG